MDTVRPDVSVAAPDDHAERPRSPSLDGVDASGELREVRCCFVHLRHAELDLEGGPAILRLDDGVDLEVRLVAVMEHLSIESLRIHAQIARAPRVRDNVQT